MHAANQKEKFKPKAWHSHQQKAPANQGK